MSELDASGLDRVLSETRRILESVPSPMSAGDPVEGAAETVHGQVRATVSAAGSRIKITGLELDPRVMRMPSEDLAGAILAAVNAAIDEASKERSPVEGVPTVDTQSIAQQVGELQEDAMREMRQIFSGIDVAMRKIEEMAREAQR